uniref:DNA-directed DNA polymerase n=1 Tax=Kalanchoe fedtschenkoi TaxID=63787 RepID=A0A7N0TZ66_KALFE
MAMGVSYSHSNPLTPSFPACFSRASSSSRSFCVARRGWPRSPVGSGNFPNHYGLVRPRQFIQDSSSDEKQQLMGMASLGHLRTSPSGKESARLAWSQATEETKQKKNQFINLKKLPVKTSVNVSSGSMQVEQDGGWDETDYEFSARNGAFNLNREQFPIMPRSEYISVQEEQTKSKTDSVNGNDFSQKYSRSMEFLPFQKPSLRVHVQSNISTLEKDTTERLQDKFEPDSDKDRKNEVNGSHVTVNSEVNGISKKPVFDAKETDLRKKLQTIYSKVLVVDSVHFAKEVVKKLTKDYKNLVHACDTEVAQIDVKQETPVNHGEIICFSIYSGAYADYGTGKSCIWVDVLDGGGREILLEFAPFFEDPTIKKVWHNYSFDKHIIENYGIVVSGFHADTMHMARLWDSSRRTNGGYSLEALTGNDKLMDIPKVCKDEEKLIGKVSMKTIFGRKKVKKDGSEGKVVCIPPVEELQRDERKPWICYSALDSISTLKLYESLRNKLENRDWMMDGCRKGTMLDFYEVYWQPFGELLVKMETEGMLVDREYLSEIEKVAIAEQKVAADRFRKWASRLCPDAALMNVGSDTQLRQLFFGGVGNCKDPSECLPKEKNFKVPNVDKIIEEGKKTATKFRTITLHNIVDDMPTEMYTATGWPSMSGDALKIMAGKISAEFEIANDDSESESEFDDVENDIITNEGFIEPAVGPAEDTSAYGTAYEAFGGGHQGKEACHAIAALCQMCSIDSLISNFILPLQGSHISGKNGRIHCSLNINTETGRLSARRPNLQNQPALEKDRYKVRQAFIAAPGKSLVVADYGQLELRILAHLANCKSMIEAFKAGGDFHSRTAMNMYPHIREAVEHKKVLLEWHPQPGEDKPPVPLLKDAFASERRKAKMLNFSIAYGKTPVGLARDWKVSVKEARETVKRWYNDRQEVLKWQELRKIEAIQNRKVHTLLGRARMFPSVTGASSSQKGHIERAAINTPVQGSAADVAMCAMLEITRNERLKELGWKLILQVHDEVILEGPTESSEEAKAIVVDCMSKPFNGANILKVDLAVDAKCAKNWYAAK